MAQIVPPYLSAFPAINPHGAPFIHWREQFGRAAFSPKMAFAAAAAALSVAQSGVDHPIHLKGEVHRGAKLMDNKMDGHKGGRGKQFVELIPHKF
uniref:Uncharacterized protein n=1 Tax=Globodera rostochiensis TaxID=31243 RepID=A0A914H4H4_GLORO